MTEDERGFTRTILSLSESLTKLQDVIANQNRIIIGLETENLLLKEEAESPHCICCEASRKQLDAVFRRAAEDPELSTLPARVARYEQILDKDEATVPWYWLADAVSDLQQLCRALRDASVPKEAAE